MMQPTCQSFQWPRGGAPSLHLQFVMGPSPENPELSEQKPIGLCLSGRLIQKPIWHRQDTSVQRGQTYGGLTYHYLSSFPVWPAIILSQLRLRDQYSAGSTALARRQPKSAGPLPPILNDSSCIMETILFALLTEGCLKVADEEMGLQHQWDLPDSLHIVWAGADQCNM